jgi:hypothetical protein
MIISKNPILKKIVEGEAKDDMIELLVEKQLPLTEEEYLEGLALLLKNEQFRPRVLDRLKQISESTKINYIEKSQANHKVAYFVLLEALTQKNHKIIGKLVKNQALPTSFLVKLADKGDLHMLEILLDNQVKLIAFPEIMEAMEKNPEVSNFIKGKIKEIRDFYLDKANAAEIPAEEVLDDVKEVMTAEAAEPEAQETQEDEEESAGAGDEEEGLEGIEQVEEKALTLLQEINQMSISERIKLAFSGSRTHRMILIKDPNKMVSMAVMESPKITLDEILLVARNKSIAGEIVGKVARNREWIKNYNIMLELVQNPKTPVKEALGFIKKLHARDLKQLARNKNINPVVRQLAFNYHSQRSNVH